MHIYISPNNEELVIAGDLTVDETSKVLVSIYDLNRYSTIKVNGNYYFNGDADLLFKNYVPQIGNSYQIIQGLFGSCDINTIDLYKGDSFGFDVYLGVQCKPNGISHTVTDINYTTAKSWDGEGGDNSWNNAANWDPNGIPGPNDRVIINLPSGGYCNTIGAGLTEVYSLSVGDNNTLAINGDLEAYTNININKAGNVVWNAGAVRKNILNAAYSQFVNYGTMTIDSPGIKAIEKTLHVLNYGTIEFNQGTLNINDGRLYNMEGSELNINNDNITIGYVSSGRHQLGNTGSIIRKTNGTGISSINLDDFTNHFGTIICNEGTLVIGEALNNLAGTLKGSGNFQLPTGYVLNGSLAPGNSPGILKFEGDLKTGASAAFNIDIDGMEAGVEYDQILVTNQAILDGNINVNLGYLPANDASFEILKAGTLNSCDFPSQVTTDYNGTSYTFNVICQNNTLYLNGPNATLSTTNLEVKKLQIYPNPVSNVLNIKWANTSFQGANWQLFSQLGQKISYGILKEKETKILVENLKSGLYILQIKDHMNNILKSEKIIVNK